MTPPLTPESLPEVPDEWLEVYLTFIDDDPSIDHEAAFAQEIRAITRMHEIEVETDICFPHVLGTDVEALRAELRRRRGEPEPPKLVGYTEALNFLKRMAVIPHHHARRWIQFIPSVTIDGRLRYRQEDIDEFVAWGRDGHDSPPGRSTT